MFFLDLRGRKKYIFLLSVGLLFMILVGVFSLDFGKGSNYLASQVSAIVKLQPIYRVAKEQKQVGISFDATWGSEYTEEILNKLDAYQVKATFFLPNTWITEYPELSKEIAQRGHEIGLHSATHPHFNTLSAAGMEQEIQDNYDKIKEITGQSARLFRPPFNEYNNTCIEVCDKLGVLPVLWSVDSLDWQGHAAKEISATVLPQITPGEIMLFDSNGKHTAQSLDLIFASLLEDGYQIVPLSRLLLQEESYIDYGGTQRVIP